MWRLIKNYCFTFLFFAGSKGKYTPLKLMNGRKKSKNVAQSEDFDAKDLRDPIDDLWATVISKASIIVTNYRKVSFLEWILRKVKLCNSLIYIWNFWKKRMSLMIIELIKLISIKLHIIVVENEVCYVTSTLFVWCSVTRNMKPMIN